MSRIEATLREKRSLGGKALVPFFMYGYPDLHTFEDLLFAAEAAGADVVEVGLPFSDPAGDGPAIRRASHRALAAGATATSLFESVAGCRARGLKVPLLLMTYFQPVRAFGTASLCRAAAQAARRKSAPRSLMRMLAVSVRKGRDASPPQPLRPPHPRREQRILHPISRRRHLLLPPHPLRHFERPERPLHRRHRCPRACRHRV